MLLTALDPRDGMLTIGLGLFALGWLLRQGLGLEVTFLVAWGRAVLQVLGLVGGLTLVLSFQSLGANLLAIALGIGLWSIKLYQGIDRRLPRVLLAGLVLRSLGLPWAYGILVVVRPSLGFGSPEALILAWVGLAVMVQLGEQAGRGLLQTLKREQGDLETRLSLGATPRQALAPHRQQVLRQTLSPQLQNLSQLGLLTVPLFLAGLLLAGVDPVTAICEQLLVLLLGWTGGAMLAAAIVDALIQRWEP